MFKVPSEIQNNLIEIPVKSKSKLHTSNIQWHRIYITIPKGKNWGQEVNTLDQSKTEVQQVS